MNENILRLFFSNKEMIYNNKCYAIDTPAAGVWLLKKGTVTRLDLCGGGLTAPRSLTDNYKVIRHLATSVI